jgi:hypothetical protein
VLDLSKVMVSGPLSEFAVGFADHMTREGYTPRQARMQLWLLNSLSNWLTAEGLSAGDLCAKHVERFQHDRCAAGYKFLLSMKAMQPILKYLRGLGVVPAVSTPPGSGPVEETLGRYRNYLLLERGIANGTACRYIELALPFLQAKASPDGLTLDLQSLTAADVVAFVVTSCPSPDDRPSIIARLSSFGGHYRSVAGIYRAVRSRQTINRITEGTNARPGKMPSGFL